MGERIREARKQKGLTQAELASLIGVQRAVISKYETNMIEPSIKQLKKIADALDVSIGYLQGYESIDTFQIVQALKNNNLDEIEKLAKLPKGTLDETSPKNRELIKEFAKKATESLLRSSTVEVSLVNEHVENSKRKTDVIVGLMMLDVEENTASNLIENFLKLTKEGQEIAVENIKIIAGNPKYTTPDEARTTSEQQEKEE